MSDVFRFSKTVTDGDGTMRDLLGGKGAGLAEMCRMGVPVPPGFTIGTRSCISYINNNHQLEDGLRAEIEKNLTWLEQELGKKLGGGDAAPLLLSVRSGARVSMPGMMDTILNLGLNRDTVEQLANATGNPRFAYDSYRRFIQMYSNVVLDLSHSDFENMLEDQREAEGVKIDSDISLDGLKQLIATYKKFIKEEHGQPFPEDPRDQLWGAINAVFDSWNNDRAILYRKINNIADNWGTAVNVQSMVFGNMGESSGTGVCFSRNPSTGEPGPYGEYLRNAQGEDVVAGIRTPNKIDNPDDPESMAAHWPEVYQQLLDTLVVLEKHFKDMQDTEFTVEDGKLFLLQTRNGKRTSKASLRIAIDLYNEGLIDRIEAIQKIVPDSLSQLLASEFDQEAKQQLLKDGRLLGRGLNAGPGAATGVIALSAEKAVSMSEEGLPVILVREETSPEDIAGMHASTGILTQRGGMTSHAAVVARGMGKPCVVGCTVMTVHYESSTIQMGGRRLKEGEFISIDGTTGEVLEGKIPTTSSPLLRELETGQFEAGSQGEQFAKLMSWIDDIAVMKVRTNADTPADARVARLLGAGGIGLCRTEHMFFGEDRIQNVRKMILAHDEESRIEALHALQPHQEQDFYELFREMDGLPVTIRLLDPPLHEFLPHEASLIESLATNMGLTPSAVRARVRDLEESNPMLGHRGCRLGISHPTIYRMQVSAIVGAVNRARAEGVDAQPEVMVPLIGTKGELDHVKRSIEPIIRESGLEIPIGTMIEIPRAALTADEIAESAEFFSFGTNDLTQCGMGLSRDDSGSFLPLYIDAGIYKRDPFKSIDQKGIGRLVKMASEAGREIKPDIKLGVCGEHGGDPDSIRFFHQVGLDYVSCSPYRVPIAKLAAAQAGIEERA
ncbi:pyruvate, phosphate dikinase [Acanthopleuribacter pedis]|uniref:Pyruvate, phosphate dikinase n=1 Tax=Acanthopleuribacter pedis TaxID=442870 RepID=A0A8J7QBC8_9BACT|nr:pyruvate, phosphate dikinase [Acanthopleuribacter pedis]MBO1321327.1 pyruvate, phosphate dikinase [Acanthopleuribacter pedis]